MSKHNIVAVMKLDKHIKKWWAQDFLRCLDACYKLTDLYGTDHKFC
jgi:hypothetical protein